MTAAAPGRPRLLVLQAVGAGDPAFYAPGLARIAELEFVYWRDQVSPIDELMMRSHGHAVAVDDAEAAVAAGLTRAAHVRIDGVLTFAESLLMSAARIAEQLGLAHHSVDAVAATRDKVRQRALLAAVGLPVPRHHAVRCADDLPAAAAAVGFPAVLKPTSGFGSFATFRVHAADELAGLYATARLLLDHDAPRRGTATFLLEELLIGRAPAGRDRWGDFVSIESVVVGGEVEHLTVTDKFPLAEPFRETGHIMPSTLDQGTQGQLAEVARVAIGALGLTDGACHTEIKLTADGPRVIEVNARLGGGLAEVWRLATGGDSFCDLARIALELPRARRRSFQRHACMFSPLTPARDVVVERIGDLRSVAAVPGVELASGILRRGAAPEWRKGEGILVCVYATAGSADGLFSMRDGVLAALDVGYAEAA